VIKKKNSNTRPSSLFNIDSDCRALTNSLDRKTAPAPAVAKKTVPESILKKRKANEKAAAERVAKDIERRKVLFNLLGFFYFMEFSII
jgi:hypothetical protein